MGGWVGGWLRMGESVSNVPYFKFFRSIIAFFFWRCDNWC